MKKVGPYKYYALVLADFDPVKADAIWDLPAPAIAEAFVSKMAHEYVEPPKETRHGR